MADKYNRKVLMMISEFGAGATIAIIIFTDKLWLIYLSMALQALFVALMSPARQASLPQLVQTTAELEKVNAFFQQLNSILKIVAPMLAGFLLTIMSAHQAIILDIVSFGLSVLILSRLPKLMPGAGAISPAAADGTPEKEITVTESKEPLRYLQRSRPLRLLFLSSFFTILIIISFDILGSVYIRDVLHGDESFMGLIIGILGAGSFIITVYVMLRRGKARYWQDLAVGNFLLATLPLGMALGYSVQQPSLMRWLTLAVGFLGGLGNGFLMVQIGTILQITAPQEMLGRLSGYLEFTMIGGQLFSVIMLPLLIPGVVPAHVFFYGAALGLVVLSGLIRVYAGKVDTPPPSLPHFAKGAK